MHPHTRAKHEILNRYLQAWLPILTQSGFPQVLYVDGFAGPGRYVGGADGSPLIALKAAVGQQQNIPPTSVVSFRFIERDEDRSEFLSNLVSEIQVPSRFDVKVSGGREFAEVFDEILTKLEQRAKFPPTFAFIDPFGWKGVPFRLIARLMQNSSCEVMITFMYEEINRFIGLANQEANFTEFFGTDEWQPGIGISQPQARGRFFHDLYVRQLRNAANVQFVRSFEMRNDSDVTDYFLFYGTNNNAGLKKMKEAMWKVDQSGEFSFSDATDPNQMVLFGSDTQSRVLDLLTAAFQGKQTTVGQIEDYVLRETPYRETHYKRVLKDLEAAQPPRLEVISPPASRRRGTFPAPEMKIRFL